MPPETIRHAPRGWPTVKRRVLRGAGGYDSGMLDELRAAVDALHRGDVEPFVGLIGENSEWRGLVSGHLWWKQQPS